MLPVRRCDVYHPHAGVAAEAIESGHAKHAGAVKRELARLANGVNVKRRAFARMERELLAESSAPVVLCLSEYVKCTVRKHYPGLGEDRLATLFNAVDLAKFNPAARPEVAPTVRAKYTPHEGDLMGLMIAQDFERKGLAEAIDGLADARQERLRLVVVGKQNPSCYRTQANREGVAEQVDFAGPTTDPFPFYAAADFFVLPTRHDPCSLVVLEALAMGLPVISTNQNGACEIMTPGVHGFVLDSADDIDGLATAMRALCDNATRKRMSEACLALRPKLAYGTHLDTLMRIYQGVLDRPAPGSGNGL
jgi:UDP-glucose:(heptosyl)LPS alpha-1,3-glucosyltransferase